MADYQIVGQQPLQGSIQTTSGKNSPIALICASLLMRGVVRFHGITPILELERLLEVLQSIGVGATWIDETTLEIDTTGEIDMQAMDKELSSKMRIALLLFGALAARVPSYTLYRSGGCKLGERSTRPHVYGLRALGMNIEAVDDHYTVETGILAGAEVIMLEAGDTATENILMAAVLAKGETIIRFCSANYMVQDLCHFLVACGAQIDGIGSTTLRITGVSSLTSPGDYTPMPDPVDAMAWISLAVTTKSELTVQQCPLDFLDLELEYLRTMGQKVVLSQEGMSKNGFFRIADVTLPPSDLVAIPDKLHPRPYPGMNIDNIPLFLPILTQATGRTLVHDWIYENRALYALELKKLGASVTLLDPHRVIIEGKTDLVGNTVDCPPALRPGMSIVIAMLAAEGESLLRHTEMIERGYGDVVSRLRSLGAHITQTS